MTLHPALGPGRVAVVTGAASGIGLAAAAKFAGLGMKVVMADADARRLEAAEDRVSRLAAHPGDVRLCVADVSDVADVERLKDLTFAEFRRGRAPDEQRGNRGRRRRPRRSRKMAPGHRRESLGRHPRRERVRAGDDRGKARPSAIVNTGSKQGITCPPGDTAYNVSKAGVKVVTEALAHELRNIEGARVSAHLLIPGFTFTGLTRAADKPAGAWTAEQVVDFMIDSMSAGDFYILCPDNEVTRATDERRILWAAGDIVENRPPLSRWHPDYKAAFAEFAKGDGEALRPCS